ncbi:gamma-glutamyl-gamma-aminobutyrate hydrolase family protein [Marinospirillum alkaliphilum]|uniref:gamma-glutamyl-gamma-aminobutyrate hydrolase n=1 Tax=Marinospirillum alkaliphilum DSM 21637 TaxID=1122209 RepID=A0A1K1U219_9GAMM|nr:gamma-glutamyl-gamma-aminobutyrate hydrolase family protein [Marinospirillum alkaliphilum]SFX07025.1 putative glutamine amidotransferase [Marinospirillum alkaliphilum DSM 21637]
MPSASEFASLLPVIGVNACSQTLNHHPFFVVGEKYVRAASQGAEGLPWVIPPLGDQLPLQPLLQHLDGILLTGSPSNIQPHHYDGEPADPNSPQDIKRDATNLPLIRAAIAAGVPLLGICRGFQEMNVALGGSLHQKVHELPGYLNHRENPDDPILEQYGKLSHNISIQPGGLLQQIWPETETRVNSLHGQGVNRLADGARIEALAPDGLIEAFSLPAAPAFTLAVQWHPEWQWHPDDKVGDFPFYRAILKAFGAACRQRMQQRLNSR